MSFLKSRSTRQFLLLLAAWMVIIVDQAIKNLVIAELMPAIPVDFLGSIVRLNLTANDSAAFSIGFGATWIFSITSTLAALALIWYSFKIETVGWSIMAGVLLGGIVGNLIDRLTRAPGFGVGHVIDYIQIPFNFPIFNIADMAIVIICSLTVIRIMRGDQIGRKRKAA